MGTQWRLSWEMWPLAWAAQGPRRVEKIHDDEAAMRDQLEGLWSMVADHEPRPCDRHVWDIQCEERAVEVGEWSPTHA